VIRDVTTILDLPADAPPPADPGLESAAPGTITPAPGASLAVASVLLGLVGVGGAILALAPGQNVIDSWGFSLFPNVLQNDFLRAMSDLGLAPVTGGVALVAALSVWRRDRRRALACLIGPGLAVGLAELLKLIVGRRFEGALCWPSGTTAAVTAVVAAIVLVTRGKGRIAAVILGAAVVVFESVALVSYRWHYPTDVLGGIVLGIGCVMMADALLHRLRRRRRQPGPAPTAGRRLRSPFGARPPAPAPAPPAASAP
jgi:membrane-associated phospholipid phosphatase